MEGDREMTSVLSSGPPLNAVSDKDIYRIEVSLSSRKSSVIVAPTYARLFVLEEHYVASNGAQDPSVPVVRKEEWKLLCTGIPCVSSEKLSPSPLCPSTVKVVIAEAESGMATWDSIVDSTSEYRASQTNFHVFRGQNGSLYGIQFLSDKEAERMFKSLKQLLSAEQPQSSSYSVNDDKPLAKEKRRASISKHEISGPCNFIHLAGITTQRTESCEKELTGTIRRMNQRSMSMNNLDSDTNGVGEEQAKPPPKDRGTPNMMKKLSFRRSSKKKKGDRSSSVYSETTGSKNSSTLPYTGSSSFDYGTLSRTTASNNVDLGIQHDIDIMFMKQKMAAEKNRKMSADHILDVGSCTSRSIPATTPTVGSIPATTPTAGSISNGESTTTTSNSTVPVQTLSFSTRVQQNRGYNPLPSKFTPMSSSTLSLNSTTSEMKPKRRLDSNRSRVTNISESMINLPTSASSCDLDEDSPVLVERYAQKGPETSVEASSVPLMDPDEYCNEVAKRGVRVPTGAYSYNRYVKNLAKRKEGGVLRRPASSVNASPSIPRSTSAQPVMQSTKAHTLRPSSTSAAQLGTSYAGAGTSYAGAQKQQQQQQDPGRPSSSSSSYSSHYSDSLEGQTLSDTANLVSHYTERMSEALQLFDSLVLTQDNGLQKPPMHVNYSALNSEV